MATSAQRTDDRGAVILARGLAKSFGAVEAVRGIDLEVPAGICLGLLGPNGAGKTTTMRMIMGLTRPSAGSLLLLGSPPDRLDRRERVRIGLVPQDNNLDPDLSVRRNLLIYGRYLGMAPARIVERIGELLAFMQLEDKAEARVMALSGGMKRRLIFARALLADPDLVILDEPTTGLDPQARLLLWNRLLELKRAGKTLLLTTHYMDEAQRLCDRIVLIDQGRILASGSPAELIRRHVEGHVIEVAKPLPAGFDPAGLAIEDLGSSLLLYVQDPARVEAQLGSGATFTQRPANLEDVFLRLTGRQLREG